VWRSDALEMEEGAGEARSGRWGAAWRGAGMRHRGRSLVVPARRSARASWLRRREETAQRGEEKEKYICYSFLDGP
jgi:hypothetical protein